MNMEVKHHKIKNQTLVQISTLGYKDTKVHLQVYIFWQL